MQVVQGITYVLNPISGGGDKITTPPQLFKIIPVALGLRGWGFVAFSQICMPIYGLPRDVGLVTIAICQDHLLVC